MTTTSKPSPNPLDTLPWGKLLRDIHNGQIIPVIGPGLVTVRSGDEEIPYYEWLVPKLAERLGIEGSWTSLNQVACAHLARRGKRSLIYDELRELVEEHENLPLPPGLADLAAIRDFDVFITSTFDGFLSRALRQARPGFKPDTRSQVAFHPSRPVDLPDTLPDTFVYHALGNYDTYPDFAVWEEDYMEFLCGMLEAPKDTCRNLFRELRNRSLLLIGAPFDDWIVRFFLRVAKQERLSDRRLATEDYIADTPHMLGEPLIFYFDQVIGSPQIVSASPVEFVAELRRRWAERYEVASSAEFLETMPESMARGSVFISYSHDDIDAATSLGLALQGSGIPIWLDRRNLNAGGDWEQALKRAVKSRAALFLSLISASTEKSADRFVHEERRWAAEVHVPGEIFYIPVVIDDTDPLSVSKEPEIFRPLHMHRIPGGKVSSDFVGLLRRYLEQYRNEGEVRDV